MGLFVAPALASVAEVVITALRTNVNSTPSASPFGERLAAIADSLAAEPVNRSRNLLPLVKKLKIQVHTSEGQNWGKWDDFH